MKTPVNKATVDNAKERKLATIIKAERDSDLRKKTFHNEKGVLLFFMKFLVNNQFARAKISVE